MYDRAPRATGLTSGSTGFNVGPGTYESAIPAPFNVKVDGYAPFLSMTSRETFLNISDQVVAAPGPGHYDPAAPQSFVKGGRVLASKAKRFQDIHSDTPGPGSYATEKINAVRPTKSAPEPAAPKGSLITSRIRFHRKPEAPSIPTQAQAYGYEECEDGSLKKQDPPLRDNTLGPAFYQPAAPDSKPTKTYKGCHFGRMTSRRVDLAGKQGPGPGEYDPYRESLSRAENTNIHEEEKNRYEARIPRYHELIEKETAKRNVPGPGKYDIRGQFDVAPPKVNTEGIEVEHPPFMSQAKRFSPLKTVAPSPGTYNDPRTALDATRRITGLKRSPFGQTSVRFPDQHHAKKTPAPGAYNITGMGAESMRKAYLESTRRGVFGTTAPRSNVQSNKEAAVLPGPSHYQVKDKERVNQSRYQQLTSCFASVTSRVHDVPTVVKEIPPPGSYDVAKSYDKSQVHLDRAKPRTEAAKRKQGSFMSAASRFAPSRDMQMHAGPDADIPGPGTYNPNGKKHHSANLLTSKELRFKESKNETPAPNAYEFSPLVQDTVLIGTFNATLNNPIMPMMETPHPDPAAKHAFLIGV